LAFACSRLRHAWPEGESGMSSRSSRPPVRLRLRLRRDSLVVAGAVRLRFRCGPASRTRFVFLLAWLRHAWPEGRKRLRSRSLRFVWDVSGAKLVRRRPTTGIPSLRGPDVLRKRRTVCQLGKGAASGSATCSPCDKRGPGPAPVLLPAPDAWLSTAGESAWCIPAAASPRASM
jgi:hypothetical protein